MNVESFERETTRVATLTFPHSVIRAFGMAWAYLRISSGEGFQATDFGSTGSVFVLVARAVFGAAETSLLESSSVMKSSSIGKFGGVANEEPVFYTIMADEIAAAALESLRTRITRVFPAQIRQCIEALDDEQIWWRPNEGENSIGNLVLHVSGSLNHYLNRQIGGDARERARPPAVAGRGGHPP